MLFQEVMSQVAEQAYQSPKENYTLWQKEVVHILIHDRNKMFLY